MLLALASTDMVASLSLLPRIQDSRSVTTWLRNLDCASL